MFTEVFPPFFPIFDQMEHHLALRSVAAGLTPAQAFAAETGEAALYWSGHRLMLTGAPPGGEAEAAAGLRRLLAETLHPTAREVGMHEYLLYYPPAWEAALAAGLQGWKAQRWMRHYYAFTPGRSQLPPGGADGALPEGFSRLAVNAALLESPLADLEALREELCSERPSVADFLAKSFGVCLAHEGKLAGWCLSEYNCDGRCEVGIESRPGFRQRGLATWMTCALLEMAQAHGVRQVGWHCWADNTPSVRTALKAGFEFGCEYPVYYVNFSL